MNLILPDSASLFFRAPMPQRSPSLFYPPLNGYASSEQIDIRQPLVQYGLSSLAAVGISGELQEWLGRELSPTLLYDYPTIESLAQYLGGLETGVNQQDAHPKPNTEEAIAIIGMGCRFPGAKDPQTFWQLLHEGVDAISEVPPSRRDISTFSNKTSPEIEEIHTRWGGFLEQVDQTHSFSGLLHGKPI